MVAVFLFVLNISRVFLASGENASVLVGTIVTVGILGGRRRHLGQPAAALVHPGDDWPGSWSSSCRPGCSRSAPARSGGGGGGFQAARRPARRHARGRRAADADVPGDRVHAPPPGSSRSTTSTRAGPTRCCSRTRSSRASSSRCRSGPKKGKVESRAGRVHDLLQHSRPPGRRHGGDAERGARRAAARRAAPAPEGARTTAPPRELDERRRRPAPAVHDRVRHRGGRRRVRRAAAAAARATRSRRARRRRRSTSRAATSSSTRRTRTLPAGIDAIKIESEGGLHTLVFDDGKVPGFKLEAQQRRDRRAQGRPEARGVHVLLRHPGPPRGGHGGHAHGHVTHEYAAASAPAPCPARRPAARPGPPPAAPGTARCARRCRTARSPADALERRELDHLPSVHVDRRVRRRACRGTRVGTNAGTRTATPARRRRRRAARRRARRPGVISIPPA